MKKITFLGAVLLLFSLTINAQDPVLLTGSDSPELIDGGVFCGAGNIQDLNAFRSFVLTDFGVEGDFMIDTVQYGAGAGSLLGAPAEGLTVTISVFTTDVPFPTGTLTEIASTTDVLFDGDGGILRNVAIEALIPAGSEVVIQTAYANDGITNVTIGSGGANINGNISWISSVGCLGDDIPVDLGGFGLANAWTLNAIGSETLSVEDNILAENLSLFPNPTNGDMTLDFARSFGQANVSITNITGQTVMNVTTEGSTQLETSRLASGIYFAQIATDNASTVIKFVKN